MTGRIQIVRPDGGTTTLPEDCRVVIGQDMVDRARRDVGADQISDERIRNHLEVAINGPDQDPDLTAEMIVAGKRAARAIAGVPLSAHFVASIFRAMDAARPKAEK